MRELTLDNVFEEIDSTPASIADPLNHRLGDVSMNQLLAHHNAPLSEEVFLDIQEGEEEFDGGDDIYF